MKKNIFKITLVAAFAAVAGYNVYTSQQETEISDLTKANVEALSDNESDIEDLIKNCTWQENSYCHYIVVTPNGNTVWSHWNMRNYY